jgi:hypothetical protein
VLQAQGGRQGENETANGVIQIKNTSTASCSISQPSGVALITSSGATLPVDLASSSASPQVMAVLKAGQTAMLIVNWSNWCGTAPGPLTIELTWTSSSETVSGPFNGPPAYDFIPPCINPGSLSHLEVVQLTAPQVPKG